MATDIDLLTKKLITKNINFNLRRVARRIKTIQKSLPYIVVRTGLLSKGKKNIRKRLFGVQGFANKNPVRNPAHTLRESGVIDDIWFNITLKVRDELVNYINTKGRPGSLISRVKKVIKPNFESLSQAYRDSFHEVEPKEKKRPYVSKIPLVSSGKLMASVRTRFMRIKKKEK